MVVRVRRIEIIDAGQVGGVASVTLPAGGGRKRRGGSRAGADAWNGGERHADRRLELTDRVRVSVEAVPLGRRSEVPEARQVAPHEVDDAQLPRQGGAR